MGTEGAHIAFTDELIRKEVEAAGANYDQAMALLSGGPRFAPAREAIVNILVAVCRRGSPPSDPPGGRIQHVDVRDRALEVYVATFEGANARPYADFHVRTWMSQCGLMLAAPELVAQLSRDHWIGPAVPERTRMVLARPTEWRV